MLPVSSRHSKIRRKAFCFLLCCTLIFPVIAVAGSVPAAALTYELGSPSFFEYYDAGNYGFTFYSSAPNSNVVNFWTLENLLDGIGLWYNPGRVPLVENIPSSLQMEYHLDSYFDKVYLSTPSGYIDSDSILFVDFDMKARPSGNYDQRFLSCLRFTFPAIKLPDRQYSDHIFKLNYSFDFFDPLPDQEGYQALKDLFNDLVSPALYITGSPETPPFIVPASSLIISRTETTSYNLTAYFDFTMGDLYSLLSSSGIYTHMQPVVTLPDSLYLHPDSYSYRVKQKVRFPTEYELISGGQYGAELEAVNDQLQDIETAINNQSTVIISGVQDALEDTLINNRDPENDEKISEMESKQVEVSEVMSDYDRFHSRIKQAAQSELSVPDYLGLDPQGGFADMIGQIVSLPLFLGIIPVGLFFGLLKILFGTGG